MAKKSKKSKAKTAVPAAPVFETAPVVKTTAVKATVVKTTAANAAAKAAPTPAAIQARAHQIWIAKGKPVPGTPVEDWLQAEREIGAGARKA